MDRRILVWRPSSPKNHTTRAHRHLLGLGRHGVQQFCPELIGIKGVKLNIHMMLRLADFLLDIFEQRRPIGENRGFVVGGDETVVDALK